MIHPSPPSRVVLARTARRRGLTLVELLLAISGSAVIGAAIVAMLTASAYATDEANDMRALVVRHKTISARLAANIRESKQVLATGTDYLVLWVADSDGDEVPSLMEIRRIERDNASSTLRIRDANPAATDVVYTLTDNFTTITDTLASGSDFPSVDLAEQASALSFTFNDGDPTAATLVTVRYTVTEGKFTDQHVVTARLRNAP
ncbi:MAG: type II secretion system protein [Planctomycetota bacterium]